MKLKTVEIEGKTYAEVSDNRPVYVDDSGKEHRYDAPAMRASLDKLNGVLNSERDKLAAFQKKAEAFSDLDPEKAREAVQKLADIDAKKLIDAGEVERVREEISQSYQAKLDAVQKEREALNEKYAAERISSAFGQSKFISERLAVPPDMAQATFARHFQFEDGVIKPLDGNGNPIYSEANPGELASFDEAMERIVGQYAYKDSILKGAGHNGSGAQPPDASGAQSSMKREQFDALPPTQQHKIATSGDVQIVD